MVMTALNIMNIETLLKHAQIINFKESGKILFIESPDSQGYQFLARKDGPKYESMIKKFKTFEEAVEFLELKDGE